MHSLKVENYTLFVVFLTTSSPGRSLSAQRDCSEVARKEPAYTGVFATKTREQDHQKIIVCIPWWLRWYKHLPTMRETWVWSLSWEDPLEKEMATHSSIFAWKSHGQRSLTGYSPWGCRVGHNWATEHTQAHTKHMPNKLIFYSKLARSSWHLRQLGGNWTQPLKMEKWREF